MRMILEQKDIEQAIIDFLEEKGLNPEPNAIVIDHDGVDYYAEINLKD
jgi:hypothetical protein